MCYNSTVCDRKTWQIKIKIDIIVKRMKNIVKTIWIVNTWFKINIFKKLSRI